MEGLTSSPSCEPENAIALRRPACRGQHRDAAVYAPSVHRGRDDQGDPDAWRHAATRPEVDVALRTIHLKIAESTRAARPLCVASGRCCHFEAFGHRLYVTGLEAAWVLAHVDRQPTIEEVERAVAAGCCPFLSDGLCSIHAVRPFACRTFFCDPKATAWQQALHEECHAEVRALHERLAAPYLYGEWRAVLGLLAGEHRRER